jgi:hypothetical protein
MNETTDNRTRPDYKTLRREYEAGASLRELAKVYGVHHSNIRIALLRRGTIMRRGGKPFKLTIEE